MSDRENFLFERYEQQTSHRALLKVAETLSRIGWFLALITIGVFYFVGAVPVGYYTLSTALSLLVVSLSIGIVAELIRRKIQAKVDAELEAESRLS